MKRALAAVLLASAAVATAGCASSHPGAAPARYTVPVDPILARGRAVRQISGLLRAKPIWVRLVKVNGQLAWLGFSPHSDPVRGCLRSRCGRSPAPAAAYVDARGHSFTGASAVRVRGQHPSPSAVVGALGRRYTDVWLVFTDVSARFLRRHPANVQPSVARAQAARALAGGLGGKVTRLRLVWADEKLTDVDLEWVAYAPHSHITPLSGPLGATHPPRTIVGPAIAWMDATGKPFGGRETIRPRRHRGPSIRPRRSYSIPAKLVQRLSGAKLDVWLAPIDAFPAVGCAGALLRLDAVGARHIWLVFLRGHGSRGLAWLVDRGKGRYAFVSAKTGRVLVSEVKP